MNLLRNALLFLGAATASLWWNPVLGRGPTGEETALAEIRMRLAPLTLSGDGQWLVYVDAKNILHRQNQGNPKQEQHLPLPLSGWSLAATRSGDRIALATGRRCIAVVDFGTSASSRPALRWLPGSAPDQKAAAEASKQMAPADAKYALCDGLGNSPVAITQDGRLLAAADRIVDIKSGAMLATLPAVSLDAQVDRYTLRLQFVDNDTRLFMATATLGQQDESAGLPSNVQFSVWDIGTHALSRLVNYDRPDLDMPQSYLFDLPAGTGVLSWVNSDRYMASVRPGRNKMSLRHWT